MEVVDKYIVWFENGKCEFYDDEFEVAQCRDRNPQTVTRELYNSTGYVGEVDEPFEEWFKEYEKWA